VARPFDRKRCIVYLRTTRVTFENPSARVSPPMLTGRPATVRTTIPSRFRAVPSIRATARSAPAARVPPFSRATLMPIACPVAPLKMVAIVPLLATVVHRRSPGYGSTVASGAARHMTRIA
jgi:hypothetical protein